MWAFIRALFGPTNGDLALVEVNKLKLRVEMLERKRRRSKGTPVVPQPTPYDQIASEMTKSYKSYRETLAESGVVPQATPETRRGAAPMRKRMPGPPEVKGKVAHMEVVYRHAKDDEL